MWCEFKGQTVEYGMCKNIIHIRISLSSQNKATILQENL